MAGLLDPGRKLTEDPHAVSQAAAAFFGAIIGAVATIIAGYFGPLALDRRRARIQEERDYGPRKELLMRMLRSSDYTIRSLARLTLVTGTSDEECRRLLIEIGARGVRMKNASGESQEGWALIERLPLPPEDPGFTEDPHDVP